MRNFLLSFSICSLLIACGPISITDSSTKSLTKNSSQFSGKYVVKTMVVEFNGRTAIGTVSKGECSAIVGDADESGWRETEADCNCELTIKTEDGIRSTPVLGLSKGKLKISNSGEAVDYTAIFSMVKEEDGVKFLKSSGMFTSKKYVSRTTVSKDGQTGSITIESVLQ